MVEDVHYLTPEGLKEYEERLNYLRNFRRQEVAERLRLALEEGGELVENAEYEDAKNEQAFIEGGIAPGDDPWQRRSSNSAAPDLWTIPLPQEIGTDATEVYVLVGAQATRAGKISQKPAGRALMDKRVGDKYVEAPDGDITFEVKAIE